VSRSLRDITLRSLALWVMLLGMGLPLVGHTHTHDDHEAVAGPDSADTHAQCNHAHHQPARSDEPQPADAPSDHDPADCLTCDLFRAPLGTPLELVADQAILPGVRQTLHLSDPPRPAATAPCPHAARGPPLV